MRDLSAVRCTYAKTVRSSGIIDVEGGLRTFAASAHLRLPMIRADIQANTTACDFPG